MPKNHGLFIVLEGADGSGKTTQFRLLAERLRAIGHNVATFDFPQYEKPSSYFVKKYLNGEYGDATEVSPYTASLFYALDRYEAAPKIRDALDEGKIVLANRYVGSNMAHQGSKFGSESEQRGFFVWAESLEFQLLGIPRPSINIYLKVPAQTSYELIAQKTARDYTEKVRDGHEGDLGHLHQSALTYDLLTKLFPKDYVEINCAPKNQLLGIPVINNLIWEKIIPLLPPSPPNPAKTVTINLDEPVVAIAPQILTPIDRQIQNVQKILKNSAPKIELGDISLLAASIILKNGSLNDLKCVWSSAKTKKKCSYYVPTELSRDLRSKYIKSFDAIVGHYIHMKQAVAKDDRLKSNRGDTIELLAAIDKVIPLAGFSNANINGSRVSLEQVINILPGASPKLSETEHILNRLRPMLVKDTYAPDKDVIDYNPPQKLQEIINQMAKKRLPLNLDSDWLQPKIINYSPSNEFKLLIEHLMVSSNLSGAKVLEKLDKLSYLEKSDALKKLLARNLGNTRSKISYHWEAIVDLQTILFLSKNNLILKLEKLGDSLKFGHETPEIIEKYNLGDEYQTCFEISDNLYEQFQKSRLENLSAYCLLVGHRARWEFDSGLISSKSAKLPGVVELMIESIKEVHPIISEFALGKGTKNNLSSFKGTSRSNRKPK